MNDDLFFLKHVNDHKWKSSRDRFSERRALFLINIGINRNDTQNIF